MKQYHFYDRPIRVFGAPLFEQEGSLNRLPEHVMEAVPSLNSLGRRCAGARMCFRTNATEFTVRLTLSSLTVDIGMSIFGCQSVHVLVGPRNDQRLLGVVGPDSYEAGARVSEKTFYKSGEMEDVMLFFPRNEHVEDLEVTLPDDAALEPPTPYEHKPILYYGSSITEGGCSCNPFNAYNAIISNHLNVDYYNFGFSGSARGELALADYFATFDMSIFVYDYDHNAPNTAFLEKTHEAFFLRFREKQPNTPVVMMSMPKERYDAENIARRRVIQTTYQNAWNRGDRQVFFLDGETFFGSCDRQCCTIEGVHPNDLGFYRMAMVVEPVIRSILGL